MLDQTKKDNQTHVRFQLDGLSCASCVNRAETAVSAVNGVDSVSVNLTNHAADINFHAPASIDKITDALEAAGYPATLETTILPVEGATCASCVSHIERDLGAVPGVKSATMNLANGKATISHVSGMADKAALTKAIVGAGYSVAEVPTESTGKKAASRFDTEADKTRAAAILAGVISLPVLIVEMGGHLIPAVHMFIESTIGNQTNLILQFILTTIVLAWPGRVFFTKGFPALMKRAPDMNSLVALGAGAAWLYSTITTFAPQVLPAGTQNVYFESAALIVTLILVGRWLEARAKGRAGDAIRHLMDLQPETARVERDGDIREVALELVRAGDVVHVRPGDRLAVDGTVLSGKSWIDESMVTGESIPVEKSEGEAVIGGTINGAGALTYTATAVGQDTVLARIIRMVEDAQGAKLPIQAMVDQVTRWFVPVVLVVAVLTAAVWLLIGPDPALTFALSAGVAVLIIACPCAMGLATPTSIMVGTGRAAELGVLFRRGDALQTLQGVKVVALDKTGTLTEGRPELTDVLLAPGFDEDTVLAVLAAVEKQSEHPIAEAIVRAAETRGLDVPTLQDFSSITGFGVAATVNGQKILLGADRLLEREGVTIGDLKDQAQALARQGKTPIYAAIDGQVAAAIAVSDPIKETTPTAIAALKALGLKVAMITGDNNQTANAIARQIGIDHVEAEVLPDGKVAAIERLQKAHGKVAFVGDGINDAPALAAADIGLAVGTGTDIAIEAADVVLMSGDLAGVVNAFAISRRTMNNIRQNLFWAFGYNVLLIPVAAGLLYPAFGLLLSPALAAGAMAMSSVFVVTNALRLRFLKPMVEAKI